MRVDDAAVRIGVSTRTIWRWIGSGRLNTGREATEYWPYWRHEITVDALVDAADGPDREPAEHGTRTSYDYGCRCGDCRYANTDRMRRYRMVRSS